MTYKCMPKMAAGGGVKSDMAADKKLVKKAIALHDKAKHGGSKPTELKNLRCGGKTR